MAIPSSLTAGDTWAWSADYDAYPASAWSGVWYFVGATSAFNVTAIASGDTFTGAKTATETADLEPGLYAWQFRVTDGATVATIEKGSFEVLADPAYIRSVDARSHARKVLDAIEAVIEGRATHDQSSMSLGNRSLSRMSIAELLSFRDKYRAIVQSEETAAGVAAGLGNPRRFYVRFDRV